MDFGEVFVHDVASGEKVVVILESTGDASGGIARAGCY